jgi:hypothetical protein
MVKGQNAPAVRGRAKATPAEARTAQKTIPEAQYAFLPLNLREGRKEFFEGNISVVWELQEIFRIQK